MPTTITDVVNVDGSVTRTLVTTTTQTINYTATQYAKIQTNLQNQIDNLQNQINTVSTNVTQSQQILAQLQQTS